MRQRGWQGLWAVHGALEKSAFALPAALCYLFGKHINQITGKVIEVSRTHIPLKALMIPLKRVSEIQRFCVTLKRVKLGGAV